MMGIGTRQGGIVSAFSNDVLVLEITGPTQEHFSVIDVPGTFKGTTHGLTTKEDISLVDNMVKGYMANPRSVMLVVVPYLDPDGDRTLGVLTKPDLVDEGAEYDVIRLVEGKRHCLQLGWRVLRNPGQACNDGSSAMRNRVEKDFFDYKQPWNLVEKEKVGIESWRERLQTILATHIQHEFPKVERDIGLKLKRAQNALKALGPRRLTTSEQARFLMDISLRFRDIATSAIQARYMETDFFNKAISLKLVTVMFNRGEKFANDMAEFAHALNFNTSHHTGDIGDLDVDCLVFSDLETVPTRHVTDPEEIRDVTEENDPIPQPYRQGILSWLKRVHRDSRGFELGTSHSSLLLVTMREQAEKWRSLAMGYISDVIALIHSFIIGLFKHIVPSDNVLEKFNSGTQGKISRSAGTHKISTQS
ncbi:hypothetical protein FSARC_11150 [Fusarium sarcochroum]|uniref:Dynamin stalk domain-containing protein n=1 Tax=Fusarium sarcochroum TaxID=1208366 RepID=A0A8H4TH89_9HYPO|nr:hypothetical protein FSARC_11150 [Fusarium sarcochroum]